MNAVALSEVCNAVAVLASETFGYCRCWLKPLAAAAFAWAPTALSRTELWDLGGIK